MSASRTASRVPCDRGDAVPGGQHLPPVAARMAGDQRRRRDRAVGKQADDHRLGHDAGADDGHPHGASWAHPTSFSSPTQAARRRDLVGRAAAALQQLDRDPSQAPCDGDVRELELGAAHPQRPEALLALGAEVARLVDRLGIVAARARRVARRGPDVADSAGRADRGELHLRLLEVPQGTMRPGIGRPPRGKLGGAIGCGRRSGARASMIAVALGGQVRRSQLATAQDGGKLGEPAPGAWRGARDQGPRLRDHDAHRSRQATGGVGLAPAWGGALRQTGTSPRSPARSRSSAARSVRSHGRSRSGRPKCP